MGDALLWGLVSASSLVIGAAVALRWGIQLRTVGLIMAFGSGVLISAVAYDLVQDGFAIADGFGVIAAGMLAGAVTFTAGNEYLERRGTERTRKSPSGEQASSPALGLVLGTVLDGIPESVVLGLTLIGGGGVSFTMLVAIFLSNLPEAIAATSGLERGGWKPRRIMGMWLIVAIVCALCAAVGYGLLADTSPDAIALVQAFAAGAILTMLADSMMPEAFTNGGRFVGLWCAIGFSLAFALSELE